jgi:molybdopterin molybdotransferase
MLEIGHAQKMVLEAAKSRHPSPAQVESISIFASLGRVLAEDIMLDASQPPFNRSMRDGYALKAADVTELPTVLRLIGENAAGHFFEGEVRSGEAVTIMTGAPLPTGADCVIMLEDTCSESQDRVKILKFVHTGQNVAMAGSEHGVGEIVLFRGAIIGAAEMAVFAAMGKSIIKVFRQPHTAILVTGDELTTLEKTPGKAEIRESNSFSFWGQIKSAGGVPFLLGIAKDQPGELISALQEGLNYDVLVVSGGVSKGKYDLVKPALTELGASLHFDSLKLKPGKPAVFATLKDKYIFGLPGNPVSSFVTFELLVRPLLRFLQGAPDVDGSMVMAIMKRKILEKSGRTKLVPVQVSSTINGMEADPIGYKGSADIFALGHANGFAIIPAESGLIPAGARVQVLLYKPFHYEISSQRGSVGMIPL